MRWILKSGDGAGVYKPFAQRVRPVMLTAADATVLGAGTLRGAADGSPHNGARLHGFRPPSAGRFILHTMGAMELKSLL